MPWHRLILFEIRFVIYPQPLGDRQPGICQPDIKTLCFIVGANVIVTPKPEPLQKRAEIHSHANAVLIVARHDFDQLRRFDQYAGKERVFFRIVYAANMDFLIKKILAHLWQAQAFGIRCRCRRKGCSLRNSEPASIGVALYVS